MGERGADHLMKGISHFASGLCAASFVTSVAFDAAHGSLLIALGGACAMLPDWLDFKFARFLERRDADIVPTLDHPDPQALADALATQIKLTTPTHPRTVQLHPARRGLTDWILYGVRFDSAHGQIAVTMNGQEALADVGPGGLDYTYDGVLDVIELGGPSFKLCRKTADAPVTIEFLAWHRAWSHSLILGAFLGLLIGLLIDTRAGFVAGLGYWVHVLEDQLGHMGSNLFWPLTRERSSGMKLLHSGDTLPNMATVWLSLTLLLLNLDRVRDVPLLDVAGYLLFVVALPMVFMLGSYARSSWHKRQRKAQSNLKHLQNAVERQRDMVAEGQAIDN